MALAAGEQIGHLKIESLIGRGGMGEVYLAHDHALKRDVALKILPPAYANDPERVARFKREAQVLASLNHPAIAQIYGFIEEMAIRGIAMEFVDGPMLAGRLPLDTGIDYALQIVEGLEYAHDRGVIHRDLKPANVKLSCEGKVKLLDFGLAKAIEDPAPTLDPGNSPTLTLGHTRAGQILGTPAYMAPEQIAGKPADRRSDIFAFGAVFYEMLTGERAFPGTSSEDTLATVLKLEPDWTKLPNDTPARVRKLLVRCLTKDRKLRLQAIGEARIMLATPEPFTEVPPPTRRITVRNRAAWAITGAAMLALGAIAFVHFREMPPRAEVVSFEIQPPEGITIMSANPAISPDGRHVAFVASQSDGKQMAWVRDLDSKEARPLPSTDGANNNSLSWSPDSRFLAVAAGGRLRKVSVAGGPSQALTDSTSVQRAATWGPDGTIILGAGSLGLQRTSQNGGPLKPVGSTTAGVQGEPRFLPDGRHLLYGQTSGTEAVAFPVFVTTLDGSERKQLLLASSAVEFAPGSEGGAQGYLVFIRDSVLMAQPFNAAKLELTGDPSQIVERVSGFSVSNSGALAYRTGPARPAPSTEMVWFDRTGKPLGMAGPGGAYNDLALSPDGKRIATARLDTGDIWILDTVHDAASRFTFDAAQDWDPLWPPDGARLFWASRRNGSDNIYWHDASGSGRDELLLKSERGQRPKSISPDGKFLLFTENQDLWTVLLDTAAGAERKPTPFVQSQFFESQGQFSPNQSGRRWVAYTSDASGRFEIYVQSFPSGGGVFQISNSGGVQARWRRDGKELFYISMDRKLMAVDVKLGDKFEFGAPHELFQTRMQAGGGFQYVFRYDVSADGKRFLVVSVPEAGQNSRDNTPITVVLNWMAGLKR